MNNEVFKQLECTVVYVRILVSGYVRVHCNGVNALNFFKVCAFSMLLMAFWHLLLSHCYVSVCIFV